MNDAWLQSYIEEEARQRESLHKDHATSRPLSEGYEAVGIYGEFEFGKLCGVMPNMDKKPAGDGGIDFVLPLRFTVDVKTARKPYHLIHEVGKQFVDIYVLAEFSEEKKISLLGWEWGAVLQKAPTKDFGYGVINHYIPAEHLKPLAELEKRMIKLT